MTIQSKGREGHQVKRGAEQRPTPVVGGAPHGFGVWIDGEFHRVDIGALGTVIVKLTEELEAARKELLERHQATQASVPRTTALSVATRSVCGV
jgi:hypothetical protein